VLSAVFDTPPCRIGTTGSVDLEFDADHRDSSIAPGGRQAVEVKSIGDAYRKFEVYIERSGEIGATNHVKVGTVATLMSELESTVAKAAAKTMTVEADARHVFVVVHLMERMCVEQIETFVGAVLGAPSMPPGLDALWVMWFPDQLAVWSAAQGRWIQTLWDFVLEGEDAPDGDQTEFEMADAEFMAAVHPGVSSPFQFRFVADGPGTGPASAAG
jgi:hypothetical protein